MSKISPCLWFNGDAEEAANFYVSLLPDSRIESVQRNPVDGPSGKTGTVLVIEFTVGGQHFMALNGGMKVDYTWAVSFKIGCEDQAEVDRLWNAILANGGTEEKCGWIRDRWGLSWQITPRTLIDATTDPDRAAAKRAFEAMMRMRKIDIAAIEAARRGTARA